MGSWNRTQNTKQEVTPRLYLAQWQATFLSIAYWHHLKMARTFNTYGHSNLEPFKLFEFPPRPPTSKPLSVFSFAFIIYSSNALLLVTLLISILVTLYYFYSLLSTASTATRFNFQIAASEPHQKVAIGLFKFNTYPLILIPKHY